MSALAREGAGSARWRPTPFIAGSIGLHCAAVLSLILAPEAWRWALGAVAANHAVLTVLGLWPRSTWMGPNLRRLPPAAIARGEIALTFDDGPDPEVTPRVLELLAASGAHATFFCIAAKAARHPDLCREIGRAGHAVENHSRTHSHSFPMLGLGGIRREISSAQATLTECTGRAPRFFRPPAGLRNPLLDPVLHEMGLKLASWTRRAFDTRHGNSATVAQRLAHGLDAGDILLMHDGNCATTAAGVPVVLEALPLVLEEIARRGLHPVTLAQAIAP